MKIDFYALGGPHDKTTLKVHGPINWRHKELVLPSKDSTIWHKYFFDMKTKTAQYMGIVTANKNVESILN
jgi:hypothetical protein